LLETTVLTGTFRDPAGSLFDVGGSILRLVKPAEVARFEALLESEVLGRLAARRAVVGTQRLEADSLPDQLARQTGTWFKHERVPFVSVPSEWSAAMLATAALHTIDVNLELVRNGFILKDATPANVLFNGTEPIFVDLPSIETLVPGRDVWIARHQFETTFLLPMMACLDRGLPIRWTLSDPATGLAHEQYSRLLGATRWWTLDRIRHVALPAALASRTVSSKDIATTVERRPNATTERRTRYVLERSLSTLRRTVARLADRIESRQSNWSDYESTRGHYSAQDLTQKREFVAQAVDAVAPAWVLDIGANAGEYSEYSASRASVVAIDVDEVSASRIFLRARAKGRSIQPLVLDAAQPTPPTGWNNGERKSFLERSTGRFDLALMLAVGHHLRVTGGIPLEEIIGLGAGLGRNGVIFEFVPVSDPMFVAIARGREHIYTDYSLENCENLLGRRGRIAMRQELSNGRVLFLMVPTA